MLTFSVLGLDAVASYFVAPLNEMLTSLPSLKMVCFPFVCWCFCTKLLSNIN
jgi:hypothetical protein